MVELRRVPVDEIDAELASNRQKKIIEMVESGQLAPDEFGALYAATTKRSIVTEEREAVEKGDVRPDLPYGRLVALSLKLLSNKG